MLFTEVLAAWWGKLKSLLPWRRVFMVAFCVYLAVFGFRYSFRSQNALDELAYATVDTQCYDAIFHGDNCPSAFWSALSLFKAPSVDRIEKVEYNRPERYYILNSILKGSSDFGVPFDYSFNPISLETSRVKNLSWSVSDEFIVASPKDEHGLFLWIDISLPLSKYCKAGSEKSGTIGIGLIYDVKKKMLADTEIGELLNIRTLEAQKEDYVYEDSSETAERLGVDKKAVLDDAMTVIESYLLDGYSSASDVCKKYPTTLAESGITVDIPGYTYGSAAK